MTWVSFFWPDRPLVAPLLELGDHHHQQLDDDRAGDVRHDPEPEHRELGQRTAGEQVEEADHAGRAGRGGRQRLDGAEVDARAGDVGPEAVDRDDDQGEENLVAQVRDPEHVRQVGERAPHQRSSPARAPGPRLQGGTKATRAQ